MPSLREEIKNHHSDSSEYSSSNSQSSGTGSLVSGSDSTHGTRSFRGRLESEENEGEGSSSEKSSPRPLKRDTSSDQAMRVLMGQMGDVKEDITKVIVNTGDDDE